jgi:signal transduction histidine kinase
MSPGGSGVGELQGRVLLLAEDDPGARETCLAHLSPLGCQVVAVPDAIQALEKLKYMVPDLILSDVMMPGMTGFEFCAQVRKTPGFEHLPFLLLTALDGVENVVKGLDAGADDFLNKPLRGSELRARIRNLMKIRDYHLLLETKRAEAQEEVERLKSQLRRADRLSTAGFLASGIGHELNNVAAVLTSGLELVMPRLQGETDLPPETILRAISRSVGHVEAHARNLLKLGKDGGETAVHERFRVSEVARDVLQMLELGGRSKGTELLFACENPENEALALEAVRTQFEQVLLNLLLNAVDAIRDNQPEEKKVLVTLGGSSAEARIEVRDTGGGIPPSVLERIFEPFFTTKGNKGTGLGLAVIRAIIEENGGRLEVETQVGQGTCMRILWPLPTNPTVSSG